MTGWPSVRRANHRRRTKRFTPLHKRVRHAAACQQKTIRRRDVGRREPQAVGQHRATVARDLSAEDGGVRHRESAGAATGDVQPAARAGDGALDGGRVRRGKRGVRHQRGVPQPQRTAGEHQAFVGKARAAVFEAADLRMDGCREELFMPDSFNFHQYFTQLVALGA